MDSENGEYEDREYEVSVGLSPTYSGWEAMEEALIEMGVVDDVGSAQNIDLLLDSMHRSCVRLRSADDIDWIAGIRGGEIVARRVKGDDRPHFNSDVWWVDRGELRRSLWHNVPALLNRHRVHGRKGWVIL